MSNGYIMVDCQSINLLASESQTIPGLNARCLEAIDTGKPIIAVNCEYGEDVPMTPIAVMGIIEDGTVIFTAAIWQIRIASDDTVTIVPLINSTKSTKKS